jgi:hypothetical protein
MESACGFLRGNPTTGTTKQKKLNTQVTEWPVSPPYKNRFTSGQRYNDDVSAKSVPSDLMYYHDEAFAHKKSIFKK